MSVRIVWSRYAVADRAGIFDFIALDNLRAAIRIDEALEAQIERLKTFPESGRLGRVTATRELPVPDTPYLVAYAIEGNSVRILRVLHGAQRWPQAF